VAVALLAGSGVAPPTAHADPPPSYEVFTGPVDAFYQVPDPLPPGSPGQLIRVQAVSATSAKTTVRIMYHSVDAAGRDRAVTGTMTYPNAAPPPEGWPVMSIANGTVGLAPKCAPSRSGNPAYDFGIGGVAVDSDLIGMGPPDELQAYLSRPSEGHSVLDAVRAAQHYAASGAGDRFVVLGGSQGGHGALSANELAASYAPELHLLGTVALAPAAMFDRTYGSLDELVARVVGAMGLLGLTTEHPEVVLSDYVSPEAMPAFDTMRTECRDAVIVAVLSKPFDTFYIHDPITTEPARSLILANDVGNVRADSPVLLVQGTADVTVFPARTHDLLTRMCGVGQVTEYVEVPGADHGNVTGMAIDQIEAWLADRLAGRVAPDSCPDVPPLTSPTTTTTTSPPTTSAATTAPETPESTVAPSSTAVASPGAAGRATSGTAPSDGTLATTGAPLAPLGQAALGCIAVGLVALVAARRRAVDR
jgi:hypothetical protein